MVKKLCSVIIRRANKDDVKHFVEIYVDAYRGLEEYAYTTRREIRNYFKWLMKRDPEGVFFAELSEPVGFIACDSNWFSPFEMKKVGEIHELAVKREFWGKGIGSKLLEKGIEYLRDKKMDYAELWVGVGNERAKKFYEKHGFKEKGRFGKWVRMFRKI